MQFATRGLYLQISTIMIMNSVLFFVCFFSPYLKVSCDSMVTSVWLAGSTAMVKIWMGFEDLILNQLYSWLKWDTIHFRRKKYRKVHIWFRWILLTFFNFWQMWWPSQHSVSTQTQNKSTNYEFILKHKIRAPIMNLSSILANIEAHLILNIYLFNEYLFIQCRRKLTRTARNIKKESTSLRNFGSWRRAGDSGDMFSGSSILLNDQNKVPTFMFTFKNSEK